MNMRSLVYLLFLTFEASSGKILFKQSRSRNLLEANFFEEDQLCQRCASGIICSSSLPPTRYYYEGFCIDSCEECRASWDAEKHRFIWRECQKCPYQVCVPANGSESLCNTEKDCCGTETLCSQSVSDPSRKRCCRADETPCRQSAQCCSGLCVHPETSSTGMCVSSSENSNGHLEESRASMSSVETTTASTLRNSGSPPHVRFETQAPVPKPAATDKKSNTSTPEYIDVGTQEGSGNETESFDQVIQLLATLMKEKHPMEIRYTAGKPEIDFESRTKDFWLAVSVLDSQELRHQLNFSNHSEILRLPLSGSSSSKHTTGLQALTSTSRSPSSPISDNDSPLDGAEALTAGLQDLLSLSSIIDLMSFAG